jgi:hypothetical protein
MLNMLPLEAGMQWTIEQSIVSKGTEESAPWRARIANAKLLYKYIAAEDPRNRSAPAVCNGP